MDTKKLIMAIGLSIVVIIIYQMFFMPKPQPRPVSQQPQQTQEAQAPTTAQQEGKQEPPEPSSRDISDIFAKKKPEPKVEPSYESVKEDLKGEAVNDITVETDLFTAVFTSKGAGLKSFVLKKYKDDKMLPLDLISGKVKRFELYPFYFSTLEGDEIFRKINNVNFYYDEDLNIRVEKNGRREITFRYADAADNLSVIKKFVIPNNSYVIDIEHEIIKEGKKLPAPFVFGPDLENNIRGERMGMKLKIGAYNGNGFQSVEFDEVKTERVEGQSSIERAMGYLDGFFYWAAYERAYFAAIFKTVKRDSPIKYSIVKEKIDKNKRELYSYIIVTDPEKVFLGPKDEEILASIENIFPEADRTIEYGWLGGIAKVMLKAINFTYRYVPNYGWALVIFTLFLKILLFPLTYTSSVSMAKMQTLQPKIKAIKKKYKNLRDPEQRKQMNMETMALYKQEKVNPASGCLPLLLQLPILFGVFNLLRTSINVRHEPWILWIKDLSLKDPIYLLPILMGLSQIILQKMSPSGAEGVQKKMMYIMPVVITIFVMSLPSGLNLYWFVSNILQIGQQQIINKKIYQKKKEEDRRQKEQKRKKGVKKK